MTNKDVYQKVTDKVLELIEQGTMPWQLTWTNGLPINGISKKNYRGINIWLLGQSAMLNKFTSNVWLTYKQVSILGGQVIKGSKSTFVTFSSKIEKSNDKDGEKDVNTFWIFRYYNVFNLDQTTGIEKKFESRILTDNEIIQDAENMVNGYNDKPAIVNGLNPCYIPIRDEVQVPNIEKFTNSQEYYAALFHELVHSTGSEKRLKRDITNSFGDELYSKEEMIAEFGASYLNALTGITTEATEQNSASYIDGWSKKIKKDPAIIMRSASKAMRAVDYMQGLIK